MKRTITTSVLGVIAIMLYFTNFVSAAIYPVYVCGDATVTLKPAFAETLAPGDKVIWSEVGGSAVEKTSADPNFTTPDNLSAGVHQYTVHVISASPAECKGDVSDVYEIYKLPETTLALSNPSNAKYCEENSGSGSAPVTSSVITATATPAQALPEGVGYIYTWAVTKDGSAAAIAGVGADDSGTGTTNVFTMNATAKGVYAFTASAKYSVPSGSVLKSASGSGCEAISGSKTVEVTPKPGKPTIAIE
ncbi:hypothetical protein FW774_15275 [Pedobacter sp. BS3]|uniref:hypothetical protein n=1 Tax=Pedobacter sp. BS3 TaxID=2567937 RepID=UPI0011ECB710|nr:hypothetical protein [Pedobacter sp. BS3]TZF82054.1 hypothetical protein FW774_15275 [Pedobacter sp. BS3]